MSGMSAKITERRRKGMKGQMGGCTVVQSARPECTNSAKGAPAVQREHQQCKGSTRSTRRGDSLHT